MMTLTKDGVTFLHVDGKLEIIYSADIPTETLYMSFPNHSIFVDFCNECLRALNDIGFSNPTLEEDWGLSDSDKQEIENWVIDVD